MSEPAITARVPLFDVRQVGRVQEVRSGVVSLSGLPGCALGQLIHFSSHTQGVVIGFTEEQVAALILGDETSICVGQTVETHHDTLSMGVGEGMLGRVLDALGRPLDGRGPVPVEEQMPLFREAPGIMTRWPLSEQLVTGIKLIDGVIPLAKGQRQLLIGDRLTGKTTVAVDAMLNQTSGALICVYCAIGCSHHAVEKVVQTLRERQALGHTIVIAAAASRPASEQYLAPYAAAACGEHFMHQGRDVLVVFDDLGKHAWAYRQLSLLMNRTPGREAYPGDIFYVHSQLMERAGRFIPDYGGGSMTFLPIVETQQGDVTGYVQSNLISMTDGQTYFSTARFQEGFKPAIELGLSVSRIGHRVQTAAMKAVSSPLRLAYLQFQELLRLTRLRSRVPEETAKRLRRGEQLARLLVQPQHAPVGYEDQVLLFFAWHCGLLDGVDALRWQALTSGWMDRLQREDPPLAQALRDGSELTGDIAESLTARVRAWLDEGREGSA